jgi:hypothetical protein
VSTSCSALGFGNVSPTAHDGKLCSGGSAKIGSGSGLLVAPKAPDCGKYDDNFGRKPFFGVDGRVRTAERESWSGSVTSISGVRDLDGGILRRHCGMSAMAVARWCCNALREFLLARVCGWDNAKGNKDLRCEVRCEK